MLHGLPELLRTLVSFAVVLGVLVSVHEYGHYLAARLCGFHVEAFAVGFGRPVASWTDRHGCRWQIGWLPLGGFVRLHGHVRPEQMTPEDRALLRPGEGFHDKPLAARAFVTIAGPIANFALAALLFFLLVLAVGRPIASPVIGEITPGQAAARAGLLTGDRVLAIDDTPIATFIDIQRQVVAHPGQVLHLRLQRGQTQLTLPVTPDSHTTRPGAAPTGMLGIRSGATVYQKVGPITALTVGVEQTGLAVSQTAAGLWQLVSGQTGSGELGGVLRIAQLSGQAAALGIPSLLSFIAVLSVNLGLLNLMPIPILDGGHLVFYALEALRGRPLPARAQEYGFRVGLGLVVTLVVFAAFNDLSRFGLFKWVAHLIG